MAIYKAWKSWICRDHWKQLHHKDFNLGPLDYKSNTLTTRSCWLDFDQFCCLPEHAYCTSTHSPAILKKCCPDPCFFISLCHGLWFAIPPMWLVCFLKSKCKALSLIWEHQRIQVSDTKYNSRGKSVTLRMGWAALCNQPLLFSRWSLMRARSFKKPPPVQVTATYFSVPNWK